MKTLSRISIFCTFAAFASLRIPATSACGPCDREQCPHLASPCDGLLQMDNCYCCVTCVAILGEVSKTSSSERDEHWSEDGADRVVRAVQERRGPMLTTLQPAEPSNVTASPNLRLYSQNSSITSLDVSVTLSQNKPTTPYPVEKDMQLNSGPSTQIEQNQNNEEIANRINGKHEVIIDALHDTVVNQTEPPPAFEDKIRNTIRNILLKPLQRGSQVVMDLGTIILNLCLAEGESERAGTEENTESSVNNDNFTAVAAHSSSKQDSTALANRIKRETERHTKKIRAMQILHQVLKDGNSILQMLTDSAPQQVMHCALSQVSAPGSGILAYIARVIMEVIHESATYTTQTESFVANRTRDSLNQDILEAIAKGFAKSSTSIPKIVEAVKEFLSLNPTLIESKKIDPTQAIESTLGSIRDHLESINKLLEEVTNAGMRQTVKSEIREFAFPGSKVLEELVDAIMAVTNVVSKSILESAFIKQKSSLQNLLELVENSIIVGVIESYRVAVEVISVAIETIENGAVVHKEETSNDDDMQHVVISEATKIRPVLNAYLRFICDNFKYTKIIHHQMSTAAGIMTPVLEFFIEVYAYFMEILNDMGNIVCTSKVLDETDSWDGLIEARTLMNNTLFERLSFFQTKYNTNSTELNKLLNYLGCDDTAKIILHDNDFIKNKTMVEIAQIALKHISNELQMNTKEMIDRDKNLSVKIAELPGGKILNVIIKLTLKVINEMSRKMCESDFVTKPPTWFNFWFSVIEAVTVGAEKAKAVFFEVLNSIKESTRNESIDTSKTDRSQRVKRGSPSKISSRARGERNNPKQNPVPSTSQKTSSAAVVPKTSTLKPDVKDTTRIAAIEASKHCELENCGESDVAIRRFTPALLSQHILEMFHQFVIQICKGVQDITGFFASLFVPPFIKTSGIPFANEIGEIANEVITLSSEVAHKALETPFLRNPPTWEAAEDFIIDLIRNTATGAIRVTIRFLSFVLDQLSVTAKESDSISTVFKCTTTGTVHKTDPNFISFLYEPKPNSTNARDPSLVEDLSNALADVHDVLSVAAVKGAKGSRRSNVSNDQKLLILRFIRGILRFEKLIGTLITVLIPESCIVPAQQVIKQIATGISTLTGKLAQSSVSFQLKSSRLPFADEIADFVEKFFKTINKLSSDAANSKYLNEPNPTWSTVNKAVTSATKSVLQVSMDALVKAMEMTVKTFANFPDILVEESDVRKSNERYASAITTGPMHNIKISTRPPLAQKRVKRSYLKRMRERDHATLRK